MLLTNKLTLTVTRDSRSYEEFLMVMNNGVDSVTFNTKEFSNCGSNTVEIELEDVLNFVIRGRKGNENSNYTINVYQRQVKPNGLLLIILFSIVLVMILITVLVLIIIC